MWWGILRRLLSILLTIKTKIENVIMKRILQQDNIGSHYRAAIYQLMDKEIGCDFCFGDKWDDIKKMDYSSLKGKVTEVHNVIIPHGYYQKGMMGMLRKDYDNYIICGDIRCISTWLFLLCRKFFYPQKSVYLWAHGMLGKESSAKRIAIRLFYSLATGGFIYNERSCKIMRENGIKERKLHPIYNSLDYDSQLPIRESLKPSDLYQEHFGNENKNIVFIGRLTKVKRFDLLLDAVALLKERGEQVNVTFIGDGVERRNMEQRVKELGIDKEIWFYGACYDEKTNAELIYNADMCVSPGNIGLTAMHVLMFGCPAITNNDFDHQMPEFEAIQEGVTGAFFKAGDSNSLADTISRWFSTHSDDREAVRSACYKEMDTKWNPHNQICIIKKVLEIK